MRVSSLVFGACVVSRSTGQDAPILLFGPTAARGDENIARETLALLDDDSLGQWSEVRNDLRSSGGALHFRTNVIKNMDEEQQRYLATQSVAQGVDLSVEIGGAACEGTGYDKADKEMSHYQGFIENGGKWKYIGLESMFSRTSKETRPGGACEGQSIETTAKETAMFAKSLADRWPDAVFVLYDAISHFHVGPYPTNNFRFDMELIDAVKLLKEAMDAQGVKLSGVWFDSPYEVSNDPEKQPHGYDKIALATSQIKELGLKVGKCFNSGDGGKEGNQQFHTQTMADFHRTIAKVPISSWDYAMVETWFKYPDSILPESEPWTTSYTTRQVFREILNENVQV